MWFEKNAEEAMNFYVDIFKTNPHASGESKITNIKYYPEGSQEEHLKGMDGKVLTGVFLLDGQQFMAIDGGPHFKPTGAISFLVECDTQEELDHYWYKLSAVPEFEQCGWLQDKYGFTWQITPKLLPQFLTSTDKEKSARAMRAMMQMKKIDMATLQKAYESDILTS